MMYVYSTTQWNVKAPNRVADIVWTRALEVKEGNSTYCKRKQSIFNTCLGHAIASMSSHTHTIRHNTPDNNTHQLEPLNGVRRTERGKPALNSTNPHLPLSLVQLSFLERNENSFKRFCGYLRVCHRRCQITENKAGSATGLLQVRLWRYL